jgi:ABC-type multidrug transport system fused ATPase/permease subunit
MRSAQLIGKVTAFAQGSNKISLHNLIFISVSWFILSFVFSVFSNHLLDRTVFKMAGSLRYDIFQKSYYSGKTENATSLVLNQAEQIQDSYFYNYLDIIVIIFQIIAAIYIGSEINLNILIIIILMSLPSIIIPLLFKNILGKLSDQRLKTLDTFTNYVNNYFQGMNTIIRFMSFGFFAKTFEQQNNNLVENEIKQNIIQKTVNSLTNTFGTLAYIGTWIVGGIFVHQGKITLVELTTFVQLSVFISNPIYTISQIFQELFVSTVAAKNVESFLKIANRNTDDLNKINKLNQIIFTNVTKKFIKNSVLDNVNFDLNLQKKTLLIGKTGSGKSTIINLILKESSTDSGELSINGINYQNVSQNDIYSQIGILSQKVDLFPGSLRENILLGATLSDQKILKLANDLDFKSVVNSENLNREINQLSGGETRKLGLLRLLVRNYKFVILDELTSGLDPKSTVEIQALIQKLKIGMLYITHDYSKEFFKAFDHLFVLENKEIKEIKNNSKEIDTLIKNHK